jgi:hypothetical protein
MLIYLCTMDPDGALTHLASVDGFTHGSPLGNGVPNDPPSVDGFTNGAPSGDSFGNDGFANDPPSSVAFTNTAPTTDGFGYTLDDLAFLGSIADEAASLFPEGKVYATPAALREDVRAFAYIKGFEVSSEGCKISCSRCAEPTSHKNKRDKRNASGVVPIDKRRIHRKSTRCGCPWKICFSMLNQKDKSNTSVKITGSSMYRHGKGCRPSRSQLVVEKRKAGSYTKSIYESRINLF